MIVSFIALHEENEKAVITDTYELSSQAEHEIGTTNTPQVLESTVASKYVERGASTDEKKAIQDSNIVDLDGPVTHKTL